MTILGSTGSVGEQAIDVARQTGARVHAICANRNAERVEAQAREFGVTACAMSDETAAKCIYVGMSAGIAGPLLTTPGADFDDDRELAVRAGFSVGRRRKR